MSTLQIVFVCLAGGVALNCVTNARTFEDGPFRRLFVQPAAHDAGTALGAALYAWHDLLENGGAGIGDEIPTRVASDGIHS